jgi:hypothetical protein
MMVAPVPTAPIAHRAHRKIVRRITAFLSTNRNNYDSDVVHKQINLIHFGAVNGEFYAQIRQGNLPSSCKFVKIDVLSDCVGSAIY